MSVHRPPQATCTIRVYKAGLLSAVGHDVELRVARFSIQVEDGRISGEFDGTSLEIVGALVDGRVQPDKLSAKDRRDILDNVNKNVFKKHKAVGITFECDDFDATEDGLEGRGTLTIPPRSRDIDFEVDVVGGQAVCDLRINQQDWGITPYSAPLGVLRIQPELEVRISVPWKG